MFLDMLLQGSKQLFSGISLHQSLRGSDHVRRPGNLKVIILRRTPLGRDFSRRAFCLGIAQFPDSGRDKAVNLPKTVPVAMAGTKTDRSQFNKESLGGSAKRGNNDECVCAFLGSVCGAWRHCRHSRDRRCECSSDGAEFLPKALTATWWPLVSGG